MHEGEQFISHMLIKYKHSLYLQLTLYKFYYLSINSLNVQSIYKSSVETTGEFAVKLLVDVVYSETKLLNIMVDIIL